MKITVTFLLCCFAFCLAAQEDDTIKNEQKNAYGIGFSPTRRNNIYGLTLGLIGSEAMCGDSILKKSHGIHIQLTGQGLFIPFNHRDFSFQNTLLSDSGFLVDYPEQGNNRAFHNGLLISAFGTMTYRVNGISLSALSSMGYAMNGISFNLLSSRYAFARGITISANNMAHSVQGLQIGIVNRTVKLKGFQFGVWNVNEMRRLPLINWSFSD